MTKVAHKNHGHVQGVCAWTMCLRDMTAENRCRDACLLRQSPYYYCCHLRGDGEVGDLFLGWFPFQVLECGK